jgi:heat-inducible transcriptional repressor
LDERKATIIKHVVMDYVETCSPVGSKRIAERLGVSAATVRNDMHELIEAGYLEQPHTSAGRIPADPGYRFFVDALRAEYQSAEEQSESVRLAIDSIHFKLDQLLRQVSSLLATWSDCVSFVSVPEEDKSEIRRVELTAVSARALLIILVLSNGQVENKLVELPITVSQFPVEWISKQLNKRLSGLRVGEVTPAVLNEAFNTIEMQHDFLYHCLMGFFEEMILTMGRRVFVEGASRLIRHPEFQEAGKLRPVLEVVESTETELFAISDLSDDWKAVIGRENPSLALRDCSIIKSQFRFGDKTLGTVGLLGPRRMNYSRLIGIVRNVSGVLSDVLERYSYV